jgi:phospholipid N-methyltransferase
MPQDRFAPRDTNHPMVFLQEFLRNPRQVASIAPSSRFLERRIVQLAGVASAQVVVELGAGSGGTTRAMLKAMPPSARLVAIDVNTRFCRLLGRIDDARLIVHCGDATDLAGVLARYQVGAPDAVVSGIPFSTIDRVSATRIIEAIWKALGPGGRFVAYQVRPHVDRISRRLLGQPHVEVALLNLPPLHVYRWQKHNGFRSLEGDGSPDSSIDVHAD